MIARQFAHIAPARFPPGFRAAIVVIVIVTGSAVMACGATQMFAKQKNRGIDRWLLARWHMVQILRGAGVPCLCKLVAAWGAVGGC